MKEPRDLPPFVVWAAVSALMVSMWWLWPDRDSPRAATDVPVPIPVAGAYTERPVPPAPTVMQFDTATADALGLRLSAHRQIERVFGNALSLDPRRRAALETQIDALPAEPSLVALDDVSRVMDRELPPEQADQLFRVVRGYRDYVRDVRQSVKRQDLPQNRFEASVLFERIDALRRMHLDDAVALALFGTDDPTARAAVVSRLPQ